MNLSNLKQINEFFELMKDSDKKKKFIESVLSEKQAAKCTLEQAEENLKLSHEMKEKAHAAAKDGEEALKKAEAAVQKAAQERAALKDAKELEKQAKAALANAKAMELSAATTLDEAQKKVDGIVTAAISKRDSLVAQIAELEIEKAAYMKKLEQLKKVLE